MSQVFYRKWRPQALAEVVGQDSITCTLRNAVAAHRVAHAYLFSGPRGTGKTSVGRILAKAVNCLDNQIGEPCNQCEMCRAFSEGRALDLIEIDAASNRGIEEIRDLREKAGFAPHMAKYKVYIVDEVHMLTEPAFNALLKTLEEPPPYVIFVLATTEVHKVPTTILSRCQRFDFRRIPLEAMLKRLERICEGEEIGIEPEALRLIARSATGSLRDAENLLEKLLVYHGPRFGLEQVRQELGISSDFRVKELAEHILHRDLSSSLAIINRVAADGLDLKAFGRGLLEYLHEVLLVKAEAEKALGLTKEELEERRTLAGKASLKEISQAIKSFAQADFRFSPQSGLPLELALLDLFIETEGESQTRVGSKETGTKPQPEPEKILPSSLEHISQHWNEFVNACRGEGSRGNLDALLRGFCRPVELEDNTLVLGFYAEFHKGKIEDPKYRRLVERKLKEVFGFPYQVRCVLLKGEKKSKIKSNPLINAALDMGGKIIGEE